MPETRKRYPEEFKKKMVAPLTGLAGTSGDPVHDARKFPEGREVPGGSDLRFSARGRSRSFRLRVCRVPSSNGRAAETPPDCGRDARTPWCAWGDACGGSTRSASTRACRRRRVSRRLRNGGARSGGVARCFLAAGSQRCDKQNATLILATSARPTGRANQR